MAGRKRTFNKEDALDKAMRLFWNNGYAGTSIANLTSELGINTPSLYAAFGNKEQLFKEALFHYSKQYVEPHYQHLTHSSDANLKERLQACFYGLIELFTDSDTPLGCLIVKSVNESNGITFPVEATLYIGESGAETKRLLISLFESQLKKKGTPLSTSTEMLVDYLLSVSYGLAVQARAGQSEDALKLVMGHALSTLPRWK